MSLEQLIEKLIVALDKNTAAHTATAAKGAAAPGNVTALKTESKTAATQAAAPPGIDFDAVKIAAGKVSDEHGKPFAKKIIKDVGGAADLATVKRDKYAALMAAFEKAMAPKQEAVEEADDDDDGL